MASAKKAFVMILTILSSFSFPVSTRQNIIVKDTTTGKVFDTVMHLSRACLLAHWKNILLIGDEFLDDELKELHETNNCLVTRLGDTRARDDQHITDAMLWLPALLDGKYFARVYPLQIYVVKVTSSLSLVRQLDRAKNSLWHNARGEFLILDDSPESGQCHMAHQLLHTAWQNNLLSVLFLCKDTSGTVKIYTYNPFGEYAPEPWQFVSQHDDSNNRSGSLFVLEDYNLEMVNGDKKACKNIFYDKTRKLYGYPVRVIGPPYPPTLIINANETMEKRYDGEDGITLTHIIKDMNATIVDQTDLWDDVFDFGYFYPNGTYHGFLNALIMNEADVGINSRPLMAYWNLTLLYPHTQAPFCIMTKDRGNVPQWQRLLKIFDLTTITGLVIVLTTILLIHKFTRGLEFVVTFLEILRMIIGTSIEYPPRQNSVKIVHGSVMLLLLVFSAAFNGNFMSLLTTPLKRKNMDTTQDLDDYGYKIVGYPAFKVFFKSHPKLLSTYETDMRLQCFENILKWEKTACIAHCLFANVFFSQNKRVHTVVLQSALSHATLIVRRDWPLADKANILLQRYVEAGYVKFSSDMVLYAAESKRWSYLRSDQAGKMKVIVLKDLTIVFWLLLTGLTCSTLVLLFEFLGARKY